MTRSLLASIPQCPLDSTSGAARSTRHVCEILARHGWEVRVLGTTGREDGSHLSPPDPLFEHRGVSYALVDTRGHSIDEARIAFADQLDRMILDAPAGDVLLTFGSSEREVRRRGWLRSRGVKVVFFLRNLAYRHGRTFEEVDAVLTPSRFLSAHYRSLFGVDSTPLPTPIALDETLAPHAEPVFATIINPAPEKGLAFFLDLADLARTRRPDIRFLAVEGRATIPEAARAGITLARNVVEPWRVYAVTRVLLAPSAGPDAGPRVIAEAHVNGIPTIGSDRGGVPEVTGRGGFILPLSDPAAWLDLLCRLHDDPAFLQSARRNASEAGGGHRDGTVDRAYIDYFERIAAG